eukprot:scaffold2797_cov69-Phaeocystis_antarctica.AAC.6
MPRGPTFGFVIVLCRLAHAAALCNGAGAFLHVLLRHARCLQVALCGVSSFLEADLSTDSVGYGVLNSAVSWSALACAPFVTGVLIDAYPTRFAGAGLSLFVLLGHLFFCLVVHAGSFGGAVTGRAVFGVGEGLCRNHVAQTSAGWLSGGSSQRHRSCPQADPEPRPALTNQPLP